MSLLIAWLKKEGFLTFLFFAFFSAYFNTAHAEQPLAFQSLSQAQALKKLLQNHADTNPQWHALLHLNKGSPRLRDPHFLISLSKTSAAHFSSSKFSAKQELIQTLQLFYSEPLSFCRFPARLRWIKQQLGLTNEANTFKHCADYTTYQEKAPAKKISLIFASENLRYPASMMGHSFLKIEGRNPAGKTLTHTLSYFTPLDGKPLPVLILQSLSTGLPGIIALIPFDESLDKYLNKEQRNVWEYALNLSPFETALIHDHLWELKGIQSKYLFIGHNCATLTVDLIAVVRPRILNYDKGWKTPKNTVLTLKDMRLISSQTVHLANKWKALMLASALPRAELNALIKIINSQHPHFTLTGNAKHDFIRLQLMQTYQAMPHPQKKPPHAFLENSLDVYKKRYKSVPNLDLSQFKRPDKTPRDSQITFSIEHAKQNTFKLYLLPTSHQLTDDNRQYFSENELIIGGLEVTLNRGIKHTRITQFDLYKVTSLPPQTPLFSRHAFAFYVGYKAFLSPKLDPQGVVNISADYGKTVSVFKDIDVYGLLGFGIGRAKHDLFAYAEPKIGLFIREIGHMKSHLEIKAGYGYLNQAKPIYQAAWKQAFYWRKNQTFVADYRLDWHGKRTLQRWGIGYRHYF